MRIEKSCGREVGTSVFLADIPFGIVFWYADHTVGPFLRVIGGCVNLSLARFWPDSAYSVPLDKYRPLPNAHLCTGEEGK